jgi:hypothetical protein
MTQEDSRFEDGREAPLHLKALETEDLEVLSALVQDAVFPGSEMRYDRSLRRFAILLNRFRWEEGPRAQQSPERVQSVLVIDDVLKVQSQGVSRDADTVLSLLALLFKPGPDGTGRIEITLAGDGALGLDVEALEVTLKDVTKPYVAPSGAAPSHPD